MYNEKSIMKKCNVRIRKSLYNIHYTIYNQKNGKITHQTRDKYY